VVETRGTGRVDGGLSLAACLAGSDAYNLVHSYSLPLGLLFLGVTVANRLVPLALIWVAHISFARLLGFVSRRLEREPLERLEKARVGRLLAQPKSPREAEEIRAYVSSVRNRQASLDDPLSATGFQQWAVWSLSQADRIACPVWQFQNGSRPRLRHANGGLYWEAPANWCDDFVGSVIAVSDHSTLRGLHNSLHDSSLPTQPPACKLLIYKYGEMSEWFKEHAWKAIRATCFEQQRNTSTRNQFNDFPQQDTR
jgi:hypothetical protein